MQGNLRVDRRLKGSGRSSVRMQWYMAYPILGYQYCAIGYLGENRGRVEIERLADGFHGTAHTLRGLVVFRARSLDAAKRRGAALLRRAAS